MTAPVASHADALSANALNSRESTWWTRPSSAASTVSTPSQQKTEGSLPLAALIAFTFILLLSPQNWIPALKPLRIAFLAAGFAAVSLLWERWREQKALGLTSEVLTCFALLAWAFLTIPLSFWPGGSITTLTDVYIKAVIIFWLLVNVVTTMRRLRLVAIALMLCTVPLAATGLNNFVSGRFIQEANVVARIAGYEAGLSANPNDLALMLNLLLPLSIALFLGARKTSLRMFCFGVIVLNVIGVIVTFSRAGFLGLITAATIYFLRMTRRRGADRVWAFGMVVVALLALPLLPSTYVDRVATVTKIEADPTGSSQARWRDTVAAARFVMEHPIVGAGLGMDVLALNQVRGEEWTKVHNIYLEYAVDLGLPGLVMFLALFYGVFRATSSSRKRVAHLPHLRDLFLFTEALEVSLSVFLVSAFFHPVAYHFYFYYIGGLAVASRTVTNHALSTADTRIVPLVSAPA
jgi:putative inorganic carbon (hco3(-)) transporter